MRIHIDPDLCSGHGRCFDLAPEVYTSDDEGFGVPRQETITSGLEAAARLGAGGCPERAIVIKDS